MSQMLAKSEVTIANILAAAERLFLARNYAEVTMGQIAEASRLTKGALYHHFSSKEELYLELIHHDLEVKRALFSRAVERDEGCRARLGRLTRAFLELPRQKREVIKLVRRDINVFQEPARGGLIRAYQASLPELVEAVVRDGIHDGELAAADPRLLAWQFVAMVEVTLGRYADGVLEDTEAKLEHVLGLFFDGAGTAKQGAEQ